MLDPHYQAWGHCCLQDKQLPHKRFFNSEVIDVHIGNIYIILQITLYYDTHLSIWDNDMNKQCLSPHLIGFANSSTVQCATRHCRRPQICLCKNQNSTNVKRYHTPGMLLSPAVTYFRTPAGLGRVAEVERPRCSELHRPLADFAFWQRCACTQTCMLSPPPYAADTSHAAWIKTVNIIQLCSTSFIHGSAGYFKPPVGCCCITQEPKFRQHWHLLQPRWDNATNKDIIVPVHVNPEFWLVLEKVSPSIVNSPADLYN